MSTMAVLLTDPNRHDSRAYHASELRSEGWAHIFSENWAHADLGAARRVLLERLNVANHSVLSAPCSRCQHTPSFSLCLFHRRRAGAWDVAGLIYCVVCDTVREHEVFLAEPRAPARVYLNGQWHVVEAEAAFVVGDGQVVYRNPADGKWYPVPEE